ALTQVKKADPYFRGLLFLFLKAPLLNFSPNNWSSSHNACLERFPFCEKINSENLDEKTFFAKKVNN
ncbi:hypothetical protein, partial [Fructobacillus tropaeoli]|uniref:hypothetical protein n=1 Tax=Fructobacillus tropaeoli TaxID=709323 RepID=UPI0030C895FE